MYDYVSEEYEGDIDSFEYDEYEGEYEGGEDFYGEMESDSPFDETEEMELAADLLGVTNEEELEQFLGSLFRKIKNTVGRVVRSPIARNLFKFAKPLIRRALPMAGGAVGTALGGPLGGMAGGALANMAGRFFGLELEGLSPEDQEFEVARRVVRLLGTAGKKAAMASPNKNPVAVAKAALKIAAKKHAPGLVRGGAIALPLGRGQHSGRWLRRGSKIILLGV